MSLKESCLAKHYRILIGPYTTEKTTRGLEQFSQHGFKVLKTAQKPEIKRAVESIFKVNVVSVQVANMPGKQKRSGKTKNWKKAWVRLQEGQYIDYTSLSV